MRDRAPLGDSPLELGLAHVTPTLSVVRASPGFSAVLGIDALPLPADLAHYLPPRVLSALRRCVQASIREHAAFKTEVEGGDETWTLQTLPDVSEGGSLSLLLERHGRPASDARAVQAFRMLVDRFPACVAHIDSQERFLFANDRSSAFTGRTAEEMIGRSLREVHGESSYSVLKPFVQMALAGHKVSFPSQNRVAGELRHFESMYEPELAASGVVTGFYAMTFDVTELKMAQLQQEQSQQRLQTLSDNLPVLISYIDRTLRYEYCNATFGRWMDLPPSTVMGRAVADVLGEEDFSRREAHLRRALSGETVSFEMDVVPDGKQTRHLQTTYVPHRDAEGQVLGIYTLSSDVSALKEAQRQLALQARSDPLTGLANRREFEARLADAIARAGRSHSELSLLLLDVDHFKQVNDSLGHAAGDELLKEFARRLRAAVRATDTVARLGGDEFVVIVENGSDSATVSQHVLDSIREPFEIGEATLTVTTSIGAGTMTAGKVNGPGLLELADRALYAAKAQGRNRGAAMQG